VPVSLNNMNSQTDLFLIIFRFKMEFFCSCEIDFDYTKIIEVLEGQRAYVFNISIN
jgi:hypothetical protein